MSGKERDAGRASGRPSALEPPAQGPMAEAASHYPPFEPEAVFRHHHRALRDAVTSHPQVGFLACVAHEGRFEATWIAASEEVRAAIIGRHSRATLSLPRDEATAALRHLALLVRTDGSRPVARLLDLQTEIGFSDPTGRRLEAVRTDGPTFLSAGGAILILFPTGPSATLPDDPEVAWSSVPPHRWLDPVDPSPSAGPASPKPRETLLRAEDGPRGCRAQLCRDDEIPVGFATVAAGGEETHVKVSGRALDEGFLIGRYDRCEMGGPEADESLSRVHLLVVREGGRTFAIDTASTNGTYIGDDRIHLVELVERTRLDLGGVLDLTWRSCN